MSETKATPRVKLGERWAYGLFWSWNIIFLAFMLLGFAPRLVPELMAAVQTGMIPFKFLIYAIVLASVPVIAILFGLTGLRRQPGRLFALGYVVEGPLMLMLAFRLFVVREANPAVTSLIWAASLGMAAYLWGLLDQRIAERRPWVGFAHLLGMTFILAVSLYVSAWIAFYAPPLSVILGRMLESLVRELPTFLREMWQNLVWVPFWVLGFLLFLYTATLFILAPIAVTYLVVRAWFERLGALQQRYGILASAGVSSLALALCLGAFFLTSQQPQKTAFELVEQIPTTPEAAQAILAQEKTIRAGLLNAYLAPYRYLSALGEVNHVSQMYQETLSVSEATGKRIQGMYEGLLRPLLYNPVQAAPHGVSFENGALGREPRQAAELYEKFFDQPISQAERRTIVRTVSSSWSFDQVQSTLQAVDEREVHLERQEISIREHGDWADVELYEVYHNQTGQRQEVIYYFSLPESAVITGLWLGETSERASRFAYRVAPRGAAQALYQAEVTRRVDPALVEQIGPRQYRLRVFPIPPKPIQYDQSSQRSVVGEAQPLHLWLTYRLLAIEGKWVLPQLSQKWNVYWDSNTQRLLNGKPVPGGDDWMPESVPASVAGTRRAHRMDFANGQSILARPATEADRQPLPAGLHLAVVLDRSRSMEAIAGLVEQSLQKLGELDRGGANVELYLTASRYRGEVPQRASLSDVEAKNILYFGGQNAAELLEQFSELNGDRPYDAVLVLTDNSGYELGNASIDYPLPEAPVWLVHLGGKFPVGYDDRALEALQSSGGGVAGSLEEALERLALSLADGASNQAALIDGYVWSRYEATAGGKDVPPADPAFAPLAARQLILSEVQRQQSELQNVETLDQLHAIAIENSIVTPYSSMIVLVEERQKELLDHLEQGVDRFDREVEAFGETLPPSAAVVTGVPEPEEWLLLGLAVLLLLGYWQMRRLQPHHGRV